MPVRPQICFTFVGDVTRDSRLRRFLRSASSFADVSVLNLTEATSQPSLPGATLYSFPKSASLRRALPAFWRGGGRSVDGKAFDLYFAADLYSLPLAARLSTEAQKPLIYDARELYRSIAALDGRAVTQLFWTWLEKRYARRATAVITVNESIAGILREEYPDVRVFHNYPDTTAAPRSGLLREVLQLPYNVPVLLSQGGVQRGRGAFLCVDALTDVAQAELVFLGDGPLGKDIIAHARTKGVADRVHLLPAVPSEELLRYTASADLGLCMIENLGTSYYLSLPNKLFEYFAAGLPVIGSDFPEIGEVLRTSKAGIAVDPDAQGELAAAINRVLGDAEMMTRMRQQAVSAAATYTWDGEEERFAALLRFTLNAIVG